MANKVVAIGIPGSQPSPVSGPQWPYPLGSNYSPSNYTSSSLGIPSPSASKPVPTYNAPSYKEMPTYTPRRWDDNEISSLTQKKAMPGIRELRGQIQRVTGRRYDNPNVGRMTLREALQGYGSGIGSVLGGAGEAATGEYSTKFAREGDESRRAFESESSKTSAYNQNLSDIAKTKYQGEMTGWQAQESERGRVAEDARTYSYQQKSFDDAWERWKKQQYEKQVYPYLGGA
jgi:hypothetical protein